MSRRLLLLNPPAATAVSRDSFLGVEVAEGWRLPPLDLAVLSASFDERFAVSVLDAPAAGLGPDAALTAIERAAPDAVIALSSGLTFGADGAFFAAVKAALPAARLAGIGDVYSDVKELALGLQPALDAILLDFSGPDAAAWAAGDEGSAANMILRGEGGPHRTLPRRRLLEDWRPGSPRWDLFPLSKYGFPGAPEGPSASLLTEYGCPCVCGYCPLSGLGHRLRALDDVSAELDGLRRLGARSVFLRDAAFGLSRPRALELAGLLGAGARPLAWGCSMRVDFADAELFPRMREEGCVLVSFGVDSGDEESLRVLKKGTNSAQAMEAAAAARKAGLRTHATLLIGLPTDTAASVERTIALARALPVDEVSFSLDAQRHAVDYRRQLLVNGLVPPESMPPDTPSSVTVWQGRLGLSNADAARELERALADLRRGRAPAEA